VIHSRRFSVVLLPSHHFWSSNVIFGQSGFEEEEKTRQFFLPIFSQKQAFGSIFTPQARCFYNCTVVSALGRKPICTVFANICTLTIFQKKNIQA
jgi:hypothetical protein